MLSRWESIMIFLLIFINRNRVHIHRGITRSLLHTRGSPSLKEDSTILLYTKKYLNLNKDRITYLCYMLICPLKIGHVERDQSWLVISGIENEAEVWLEDQQVGLQMKHEPRKEHQIELGHGGSDNQLPHASFKNRRPDLNLTVLHWHCRNKQLGGWPDWCKVQRAKSKPSRVQQQ